MRLLIDLKEDYHVLMPLIIKELNPLLNYAIVNGQPGRLQVTITGGIPPAVELANYPTWLLFDVNHLDGFTPPQWQRVGLVSYPFTKYSKWKGTGTIPKPDAARVTAAIDSVHTLHKKIRFWETPDNKNTWRTLIKLGVDVIGTDRVEDLGDFLNGKK